MTGIKSYAETTVLEANIQGMDMTFTIEKTVVYPDKVHTVQKTPFGNMTSVVAGDMGWSDIAHGQQGHGRRGAGRGQGRAADRHAGHLRNLDAWTFQALEPRQVEGKQCNPVYASGVGDDYRILYLDAASNQVVMVEQPGMSPMTGAPVIQKVYIDEYMEADGFTMPKKMRITYDDEEFGQGTVEMFEANPKVDMGLFDK